MCEIFLHFTRVTDKVAARLLYKARPYLIHLNLRECQHLKQATFVSVSQCRNIQDLNLSGCLGLDVSSCVRADFDILKNWIKGEKTEENHGFGGGYIVILELWWHHCVCTGGKESMCICRYIRCVHACMCAHVSFQVHINILTHPLLCQSHTSILIWIYHLLHTFTFRMTPWNW